MDPLDEVELRAFEHLGCTCCAETVREYVEAELISGAMSIEDVKHMTIVVKDCDELP